MNISQKLPLACRLAAAITFLSLAIATPAGAFTEHAYTGTSFGPCGTTVGASCAASPTNTFGEVAGIAVDEATGTPTSGDIYVYSSEDIYKFNAAGEPADFSALASNVIEGVALPGSSAEIAVDSSNGPARGDIYIAGGRSGVQLQIYNANGEKFPGENFYGVLSASDEIRGVAVDSTGHVYLGRNSFLAKYTPFANPLTPGDLTATISTISSPVVTLADNVAVDSEGNVYVSHFGEVMKYEASQFGQSSPVDTPIGEGEALAVDPAPSHDDVYLDNTSDVARYNSSGGLIETFGEGSFEPRGIAVDHASENVYVSSGARNVKVFGLVVVPDAIVEPVLNVTQTEATLEGAVDPDGTSVTGCVFEYGTSAAFGQSVPCAQALPVTGSRSVPVSARATGLEAGQTYFYRVSPSNAAGINNQQGQPQQFTTAPAVDSLRSAPASGVARTTATLNGSLAPDGSDVHYYFEYGPGAGVYGSVTPEVDAGSAAGVASVEEGVTELAVGSSYHYRLVAVNAFGTTFGADETFTTSPAVDGVQTEPASGVSATGTTLNGTLAPDGTDAQYFFEYASEAAFAGEPGVYDSTTPASPTDAGVGGAGCVPPGGAHCSPVPAAADAVGLEANTRYHYRLVTTNEFGTTYGADAAFTTARVLPVDAQSLSVSEVTRTSVVVSGGLIDPQNSATSYQFVYITEAGFQAALVEAASNPEAAANPYATGGTTPLIALGSGDVPVEIPALPIRGLLPGTTYHYALLATSAAGTVRGPDGTFTTGSLTMPAVTTGGASSITQNTATISATIDPQSLATNYGWEVGTEAGVYGPPTGLGAVGVGGSDEPVSLSLTGLLPGTTYHYRITASNVDGTVQGADQQFTTPVFPITFATPPAPLPFVTPPGIAFPVEATGSPTPVSPKALTKKQKLAKALKGCRVKRGKQRGRCEGQARRKYGVGKGTRK